MVSFTHHDVPRKLTEEEFSNILEHYNENGDLPPETVELILNRLSESRREIKRLEAAQESAAMGVSAAMYDNVNRMVESMNEHGVEYSIYRFGTENEFYHAFMVFADEESFKEVEAALE